MEGKRSSVALLDVNLGPELVTPVVVMLDKLGVPFALASAYDRPERYGGDVLAGAPNAGKPMNEQRLMAVLRQLMKA